MLKKNKIILGGSLCLIGLILVGGFFYLKKPHNNGKVSLSLQVSKTNTDSNEIAEQKKSSEKVQMETQVATKIDNADKKSEANTKTEKVASTQSVSNLNGATLKITDRLVSWGFQKAQGRKIDTIIIHSSYDAIGEDLYSVNGVIAEYKSYGVSPHYLIDRNGNIIRLVADQNIAYHAGESKMPDGRTGVNSFSIGIEVLKSQNEAPTDAQYESIKLLILNLKSKYKITAVLGHNQIAPDRKTDPWNFNWNKLK